MDSMTVYRGRGADTARLPRTAKRHGRDASAPAYATPILGPRAT
jgi:hypothetical protein